MNQQEEMQIVNKLRWCEHERKRGYHTGGISLPCCGDGCSQNVIAFDLHDFRKWKDGELLCTACKQKKHYALSQSEREQAERETKELFAEFAQCKTNEDFDRLNAKIDALARRQSTGNRFAPRQRHFAEVENREEDEEIPF